MRPALSVAAISVTASSDEAREDKRARDRVLAARFAVTGVLVRLHLGRVIAVGFGADRRHHAVGDTGFKHRADGWVSAAFGKLVELVPFLFAGKSTHGVLRHACGIRPFGHRGTG